MKTTIRILVALSVLSPHSLFAWDALGHGLAAKIGARLAKAPWSQHLVANEKLLASAAAFPDVPMRQQSSDLAGFEAEAPNHYFKIDDPKLAAELATIRSMTCENAVGELATNFSKPLPDGAKMPAGPNANMNAARINKVGISPWRAEQFTNLAIAEFNRQSKDGGDLFYYLGLGSHILADHAVPWHAKTDAHGEQSGHSNIHVFLEKCADRFLTPGDELFDSNFESDVSARAKSILNRLVRTSAKIPELAIEALEESSPVSGVFERLDTADVFVSGSPPKAGTLKGDVTAARKPQSCAKFKSVLLDRLARAAVNVAEYFDSSLHGLKPGSKKFKVAGDDEIKSYAKRDYIWFDCAGVETSSLKTAR